MWCSSAITKVYGREVSEGILEFCFYLGSRTYISLKNMVFRLMGHLASDQAKTT